MLIIILTLIKMKLRKWNLHEIFISDWEFIQISFFLEYFMLEFQIFQGYFFYFGRLFDNSWIWSVFFIELKYYDYLVLEWI